MENPPKAQQFQKTSFLVAVSIVGCRTDDATRHLAMVGTKVWILALAVASAFPLAQAVESAENDWRLAASFGMYGALCSLLALWIRGKINIYMIFASLPSGALFGVLGLWFANIFELNGPISAIACSAVGGAASWWIVEVTINKQPCGALALWLGMGGLKAVLKEALKQWFLKK